MMDLVLWRFHCSSNQVDIDPLGFQDLPARSNTFKQERSQKNFNS